MPLDTELPITAKVRQKAERAATKLIADNDNKKPKERIRYRGTRPAWNWLRRFDEREAAALWLVARRMLPTAANDNHEPGLKHLDRRKDGKLRGAKEPVFDAGSYLALPSVKPRLGDAEPAARISLRGWHNAAGSPIKPQRMPGQYPSSATCRFTKCLPGTAWHYGSLIETVGKPRPGKSRGDQRRVEEPDLPDMPDEILVTIEAMLAGGTLADVGAMHGAKGGYRDVRGKVMMMRAGAWALAALDGPQAALAA